MDMFKQGMKGPMRPAPFAPGVTRYSPVTNWNDDPFGADVFEPSPQLSQKKKPPPRPPPPKLQKQPELPLKPSHFLRKPTVLSSILSRKKVTNQSNQTIVLDLKQEMEPYKMFPKCEPKNVQTGALIDLSSPPSSPTFTTRSSSDGLSVDSFGSDATTSTNHQNMINGGNASQAESGFEDDFDLFLHSRNMQTLVKDDTFDDITSVDPFSPVSIAKPTVTKKPVYSRDFFESSSNVGHSLKGPTIIRAKPARPKPPDNSALLKTTFGNVFPVTCMNLNTTNPIQKINSSGDSFDSKLFCWDEESPDRESSPPMPTIPPPLPPPMEPDAETTWPEAEIETGWSKTAVESTWSKTAVESTWSKAEAESTWSVAEVETDEPHAIALFDYYTDYPEDLNFSTGSKIFLTSRVDNEWLRGRLRTGTEGLFPANYVEIKVPLRNESRAHGIALYDFKPVQPSDLRLCAGEPVTILYKMTGDWCYGESGGARGQFPLNYVQIS